MKFLITICARAGSKRVKNKNIRSLAGKPLINYAIDLAKAWKKSARIVCSTDSEEIARAAKKAGAEVPFMRPDELASDSAGKVGVIRHAFNECEKIFGEKYDFVVDLDVSSPVKTVSDLDTCLKIFEEKKPEMLFSVTKARRSPYFNMVELNDKGFAVLCKKPSKPILRTQDTPAVYDMNAAIYFYSRSFLLDESKNNTLASDRTCIYVMPEISAVDIDSELDFKYIEFLITNGVVKLC